MQLRLRIRTLPSDPPADPSPGSPGADDADPDHAPADRLVGVVREALSRGSSGGAAVVVRASRIELVELRGVVDAGIPVPLFLAGLSRSGGAGDEGGLGPALAVGLAGRFVYRARGVGPSPVGLVFLEWPDCRWWSWRVVLDGAGAPVADSESRYCAVDGDALPGGLGRWWSLGRRSGRTVRYGDVVPAPTASALVH